MLSEYLIGDYADALVTGTSAVYKNPPNVLPGNRYFLNTKTKCRDASNNIQDRSVVIDNVLETLVDDSNTEQNKGLMYSFFASLESLDKNPYPTLPTDKPTAYLKDAGNMPSCEQVSIYLDDTKTVNGTGWITELDKDELDPLAIKEGFGASDGMQKPSSISEMTSTLNAHKEKYTQHMNSVNANASSNSKQVQAASASKLKSAKVKALSTGTADREDNASSVSSSKAKASAAGKKRLIAMKCQQQNAIRKTYITKYGSMSMTDLFKIFVNYKSPRENQPTKAPEFFFMAPSIPKPKQISGACFYQVLTGIPIPKIKSYSAPINECPNKPNSNISIEDFITDLTQQAESKKDDLYVTLSMPSIPSETICEMVQSKSKVKINMNNIDIISGNTGQQYRYTYTPTNGKKNPYYAEFEEALEPYRDRIIDAFLSLDYPTKFAPCPLPNNYKENECDKEGFTTLTNYPVSNSQVYFIFALLIVVIYLVHRFTRK
jgi:hypothetical protein